ncbi:MAG: tetratricopeptide repeat protein [Acidobacteria bacterium]|nr:tetratricopeptide repeat protein [Acidobacteriota bacterium]
MKKRTQAFVFVVFAAAVLAASACTSTSSEPAPAVGDAAPAVAAAADPTAVQPVALPDLDGGGASEPVREQLRQQYAVLTTAIADPQAEPSALGRAYGEMGRLFLATDYANEAETCFRNAQALLPRDRRWPYYLGHVYRIMGDPRLAAEQFEQARALRPNDLPTLVWLAEMHLETGEPGEARTLLEYALALEPTSVAVLFGLGRSAMAREDYFLAVQALEEARTLNPNASSVHAMLAAAYRSLGEMELAEANLQRQRLADRSIGNVEGAVIIRPNDPLMEEVESLVRSAASYELRGSRALARGDYAAATSRFREGLELQPDNPSLRHKLGTALALRGDRRASREQFEETVQRTPTYARAHYSLGVLLEEEGDFLQALARYTSAVRHDTNYAEARLRLAGILRLSGRPDDAMAQYERVAQIDPAIFEAPFGKAMVLVSQDRWPEAREELEDGMAQYPSAPAFPLALARLLAAAPDSGVRDGRRAVAVMERLSEEQQRMDLGETMAMALAEAGRYEEAAALQREAIAAAPAELAPRMEANLALYESGRPSRTPWRDGEIP